MHDKPHINVKFNYSSTMPFWGRWTKKKQGEGGGGGGREIQSVPNT